MRPENDMVPGFAEPFNHFFPETVEDTARSPARSQQDSGFVRRDRPALPVFFQQGIHMRQAGQHTLLWGKMTLCFHFTHFSDLVFAAQKQRVVVVNSEHPVAGYAVRCVEYMHIPADISGALPLVDIQPGRAGKNNVGLQHIHSGKGTVSFTGKLRFHMLVFFIQEGIIGGGGQVEDIFPTLFHLITEGLEDGPVAFAVREKDKGRP